MGATVVSNRTRCILSGLNAARLLLLTPHERAWSRRARFRKRHEPLSVESRAGGVCVCAKGRVGYRWVCSSQVRGESGDAQLGG